MFNKHQFFMDHFSLFDPISKLHHLNILKNYINKKISDIVIHPLIFMKRANFSLKF